MTEALQSWADRNHLRPFNPARPEVADDPRHEPRAYDVLRVPGVVSARPVAVADAEGPVCYRGACLEVVYRDGAATRTVYLA